MRNKAYTYNEPTKVFTSLIGMNYLDPMNPWQLLVNTVSECQLSPFSVSSDDRKSSVQMRRRLRYSTTCLPQSSLAMSLPTPLE